MIDRRREYVPVFLVLVAGAAFFWGLTQCMSTLWRFDFFVFGGDVYTYWSENLTWGLPLHPLHPPGYPWLIAVVRTLTAGRLPPLVVMQSLSFLFLMGGALLFVSLCRREGIARQGWMAALLFLSWPFVGSLYAVYPQMDSLILFLLILGVLLSLDDRWLLAGAVWGTATLVHPLAWYYVPLFLGIPWGIWLLERRKKASAHVTAGLPDLLPMTAAAVAPFLAVWIWQTAASKDPFWAVSGLVDMQVVPRGTLPILDGWIGTVADGGASGWLKVGILSLVVLLAVYLMSAVLRNGAAPADGRERYSRVVSAVIPLGILGLAILLNQFEIWAVVRFSKMMLLPAILQRDRLFGFLPDRIRMPAFSALIAAGFFSQVVYAWYMVRIFFSM